MWRLRREFCPERTSCDAFTFPRIIESVCMRRLWGYIPTEVSACQSRPDPRQDSALVHRLRQRVFTEAYSGCSHADTHWGPTVSVYRMRWRIPHEGGTQPAQSVTAWRHQSELGEYHNRYGKCSATESSKVLSNFFFTIVRHWIGWLLTRFISALYFALFFFLSFPLSRSL